MHHSGIRMIDEESDSYDTGGKYEHPVFQHINKDILGLTDDTVYHLRMIDCPNLLQKYYKDQMLNLISKQDKKYDDWGFKDPRTVVTYPLWKHILPEHKVIAIYRNPADNWPRHRWRGLRKRYSNAWRAFVHLRQWYEYNELILINGLELGDSFLLLNYEKLMQDDDEINRLQTFIKRPIQDMRKAGMHRSRNHGDMLFRCVQWCMRFTAYSTKNMLKQLEVTQMMQCCSLNKKGNKQVMQDVK